MHHLSLGRIPKRKEIKDLKLKIVILLLFTIITLIITFSYISHHAKVLTGFNFERGKLSKKDRIFRIFNHQKEEILYGILGVGLDATKKFFHCHDFNETSNYHICLEWEDIAKLIISYENINNAHCFNVKWTPLSDLYKATDCYELSNNNGIWFGGSKTKNMQWYLNNDDFTYQPFISGDAKFYQFGNGIKRYFINSVGVAINLDQSCPLHISINKTANLLCFRAYNDDFAFFRRTTPYPELAYRICTKAEDIRGLHRMMTQQNLWEKLKEPNIKILHSVIEEPIWKIPSKYKTNILNETIIYNYSENIIHMGYMKLGHIMVNEFWQQFIGDLTVHQNRFQNLKNVIDILHRRGFKIIFTIQPYVSTESLNFKYLVQNKFLIAERNSKNKYIPALTKFKNILSVGVLDVTNNATVSWMLNKLKQIKDKYFVDYFYLDLGISYDLPQYYQCRKDLSSPDSYFKVFANNMEQIGFIGLSTASFTPKPPAFISIPPQSSSWKSLEEVLMYVLIYGIIGFPFVIPGSVGGDFSLSTNNERSIISHPYEQTFLPSQELYIRWLQLIIFLPVVQFTYLPSEYNNKTLTMISKELTAIRQKIVIPLLKKHSIESINEGIALVRPLWMLDPSDIACLTVNDEFSIGDELIVAPILHQGKTFREVYLPQGVWKDGIDGSLRKGSRWIHNYKVPIEKVAHFIKMPDNTRF